MSNDFILGLDIGGTKTALVIGTRQGDVRLRREIISDAQRGFEPVFADLCGAVEQLLREPQAQGAARIGVSIGGPMDPSAGVILSPPHLPGWDGIPLKQLLQERFGLPTYVEHDARAGALAEWKFGAGRGTRNMVFLTAGTGFGAGIIVEGRLLRGAGDGAGEIGHWRIAKDGPPLYSKSGSLEGYASGAGMAALAQQFAPHKLASVDAKALLEGARAGNPDAQNVIRTSGEKLGHALALLIDLLAPEVIVLGTLARHFGELWLEPARAVVAAEALAGNASRCRIVPAALGDKLGDIATLCAVIHQEEHP